MLLFDSDEDGAVEVSSTESFGILGGSEIPLGSKVSALLITSVLNALAWAALSTVAVVVAVCVV